MPDNPPDFTTFASEFEVRAMGFAQTPSSELDGPAAKVVKPYLVERPASEVKARPGFGREVQDSIIEVMPLGHFTIWEAWVAQRSLMARAVEELEQYDLIPSPTSMNVDFRHEWGITDNPRYREIAEESRKSGEEYPASAAMHVHGNVHDKNLRARVSDILPSFGPRMIALTASSAIHDGKDSGFASARMYALQKISTMIDVPPTSSWERHQQRLRGILSDLGMKTDDDTRVHSDVRAKSNIPTVEQRSFDLGFTPEDRMYAFLLAAGLGSDVVHELPKAKQLQLEFGLDFPQHGSSDAEYFDAIVQQENEALFPIVHTETLRTLRGRGARNGMTRELHSPESGGKELPAAEAVEPLLQRVRRGINHITSESPVPDDLVGDPTSMVEYFKLLHSTIQEKGTGAERQRRLLRFITYMHTDDTEPLEVIWQRDPELASSITHDFQLALIHEGFFGELTDRSLLPTATWSELDPGQIRHDDCVFGRLKTRLHRLMSPELLQTIARFDASTVANEREAYTMAVRVPTRFAPYDPEATSTLRTTATARSHSRNGAPSAGTGHGGTRTTVPDHGPDLTEGFHQRGGAAIASYAQS